jgi:hypothetical protein
MGKYIISLYCVFIFDIFEQLNYSAMLKSMAIMAFSLCSVTDMAFAGQPEQPVITASGTLNAFPALRNANAPTTAFAHKRISDVAPILIGGFLYFVSADERNCFMNQVVDTKDPQGLTWSYYFDQAQEVQVSYDLHTCGAVK